MKLFPGISTILTNLRASSSEHFQVAAYLRTCYLVNKLVSITRTLTKSGKSTEIFSKLRVIV